MDDGIITRTWPGTTLPYDLVATRLGLPPSAPPQAQPTTTSTVPPVPSAPDANGATVEPDGTVDMPAETRPGSVDPGTQSPQVSTSPPSPPSPMAGPQDQAVVDQGPQDQRPVAGTQGDQAQAAPPGPPPVPDPGTLIADKQFLTQVQIGAALKVGDIQSAQAAAAQVELEAGQRQSAALLARQQQEQEQYRATQHRILTQYSAAVENMGSPSDPFSGPGGTSRILAVALGGVASGMGATQAGAIVESLVRADIARTQRDPEEEAARAQALASELKELGAANVDRDGSYQLQYAAMMKGVSDRMNAAAGQFSDQGARANAQALAADIASKAQDAIMKTADDATKNEIDMYKAQTDRFHAEHPKGLGGGGGGGGGGSNPDRGSSFTHAIPGVYNPDGSPMYSRDPMVDSKGKALDETQVKLIHENVDNYGQFNNALVDYIQLLKDRGGALSTGGSVWSRWKDENDRQREALRSKVITKLAQMLGSQDQNRSASDVYMKQAESMVPDLTGPDQDIDPNQILQQIRQGADEDYDQFMGSRGIDTSVTDANMEKRYAGIKPRGQPDTEGSEQTIGAGVDPTSDAGKAATNKSINDQDQKDQAAKKLRDDKKKVDDAVKQGRQIGAGHMRAEYVPTSPDVPGFIKEALAGLNSAQGAMRATVIKAEKTHKPDDYADAVNRISISSKQYHLTAQTYWRLDRNTQQQLAYQLYGLDPEAEDGPKQVTAKWSGEIADHLQRQDFDDTELMKMIDLYARGMR